MKKGHLYLVIILLFITAAGFIVVKYNNTTKKKAAAFYPLMIVKGHCQAQMKERKPKNSLMN